MGLDVDEGLRARLAAWLAARDLLGAEAFDRFVVGPVRVPADEVDDWSARLQAAAEAMRLHLVGPPPTPDLRRLLDAVAEEEREVERRATLRAQASAVVDGPLLPVELGRWTWFEVPLADPLPGVQRWSADGGRSLVDLIRPMPTPGELRAREVHQRLSGRVLDFQGKNRQQRRAERRGRVPTLSGVEHGTGRDLSRDLQPRGRRPRRR